MAKKLLIVSPDYRPGIGGVATCTHELALALHRTHDVTLLARHLTGSEDFDAQQDFPIHRITTPSDATLGIPKYMNALREIDRQVQPDLVLHMLWYPTAAAHWLSRCRTPYVIYSHGVELLESSRTFKKSLRKKLSFMKRKVFRRSSQVFSVSEFTKELVQKETGLTSSKISVVANGIDLAKFQTPPNLEDLQKKYQLEDKEFVFLTVSRLVAHKGIDQTLQALAQLKKNHSFKYIICGDGPERRNLEKLCQQLHLKDQVIFTGVLEEQEIIRHYHLCSCFVMLSRFEPQLPAVEGFGISFLEAGACGKPVVAGNSGGVSDAVLHGQTGLLVNPLDLDDISQSLEKMITDFEYGQKLGKQSYLRIEKELQWQHVAARVSDALA